MLVVRHARPEMRAPIRTWLRANARTLVALGVAAVVLLVAGVRASESCEIGPAGLWDCPLAAEGALIPLAPPESTGP